MGSCVRGESRDGDRLGEEEVDESRFWEIGIR